MGVRRLQKEKTRQAFMQAALDMVAEGRAYSSISLRELTNRVGVVPTAFYRHFKDTEELGLQIIQAVLPELRANLKQRRRELMHAPTNIVESSVRIYFDYVLTHEKEFLFCGREVTGGYKPLRIALRQEIFLFSQELAEDLALMPELANVDSVLVFAVADLLVRAILTTAQDLAEISASPAAVQTLYDRTVLQTRLVLKGAEKIAVPNKTI